MITTYRIGQFSTQNAYSAVNIVDYSFYPEGNGANPPAPTFVQHIRSYQIIGRPFGYT